MLDKLWIPRIHCKRATVSHGHSAQLPTSVIKHEIHFHCFRATTERHGIIFLIRYPRMKVTSSFNLCCNFLARLPVPSPWNGGVTTEAGRATYSLLFPYYKAKDTNLAQDSWTVPSAPYITHSAAESNKGDIFFVAELIHGEIHSLKAQHPNTSICITSHEKRGWAVTVMILVLLLWFWTPYSLNRGSLSVLVGTADKKAANTNQHQRIFFSVCYLFCNVRHFIFIVLFQCPLKREKLYTVKMAAFSFDIKQLFKISFCKTKAASVVVCQVKRPSTALL